MTDAALVSTLPPPPQNLPHQCSCCGAVVTAEEWAANGSKRLWHFDDETLEIAEHEPCGSTIARDVTERETHRRDEGDDAMGEERAERDAAWRESW